MKHISIVQNSEDSIKEKVEEWIKENKDEIVEVVDIEYTNTNSIYVATITYLD